MSPAAGRSRVRRAAADVVARLRRALGGGRGTAPARGRTADGRTAYPGDFRGVVTTRYAPAPDGDPDPGEIVWTWVPYEEDATRGKDRPVLLVGRDGPWLLGLMLTSKDHSRDAPRPDGRGPRWMDVGVGPWDARRRPSEVRLDRVIRVDPARVRREGAVVPPDLFAQVARSLGRP